jgi:hypothetical protein
MLHDCLLKNLYGFFLMFFKEIYWDWNSTGMLRLNDIVCLIVLVIIHVLTIVHNILHIIHLGCVVSTKQWIQWWKHAHLTQWKRSNISN